MDPRPWSPAMASTRGQREKNHREHAVAGLPPSLSTTDVEEEELEQEMEQGSTARKQEVVGWRGEDTLQRDFPALYPASPWFSSKRCAARDPAASRCCAAWDPTTYHCLPPPCRLDFSSGEDGAEGANAGGGGSM